MPYGRLNAATGELTDIADRDPQTVADVFLNRLPRFAGPYGYDSVNRLAVPLVRASMNDDQKLADTAIPPKLVAALAVRMSTTYASRPAAVRTKVQGIIDNAADAIVAALT